ncbi:MAG: GntR family transcriptional regulator [Clostridia bacterium]|nr:GntR family transcriptional regulator [Clostridia bacterium]
MTIEPTTLQQHIFTIIEERILSGELAPGTALIESKLCEELGVSRTPVREAIRQLEAEQLVRTVPNKGTIVVGVSQKDIIDIYHIRSRIEGLAARLAAENITVEELERLREILDLQEFYTLKGDHCSLEKYDSRFHLLIYDVCKSRQLQMTLSNFHHFIKRARGVSFEKGKRASVALEEHRAVYKAIASGNGDAAENMMKQHIENALSNFLKSE